MRRTFLMLFCGGCAFVGGVTSGGFFGGSGPGLYAQIPPPPDASIDDRGVPSPGDLSAAFSEVIRRVETTVVSIEAKKPGDPGPEAKPVEESGSGVLVTLPDVAGTLVLTNNHVVAGADAGEITVHLFDDRVFRPSKIWTDPESDVAVLRIDETGLPTADLGASAGMGVGDWVLAFGSPFGLNRTVTHGIISARQRGEISLGSEIRIKEFLQTDAAINPGSSGGPLVNLDGEVIGINTAIASRSGGFGGISFAIPIDLARDIAVELITHGRVQRAYLGVQLAGTLEPAVALRLGLTKARGALVEIVYPDTPAARSGLKRDDVILRVNGEPIRNENHLINMVAAMEVGTKIRLEIWRDRASRLAEVEVGDWSTAGLK